MPPANPMSVARRQMSSPVGMEVADSFMSESPQEKLAIAASMNRMPAVLLG